MKESKITFSNTMSMPRRLDQIKIDIWLVLTLVQAVCKGYQYMTLACKETFTVSTSWKDFFLSPDVCRCRLLKWDCLSIFLCICLFIDTTGRI